MQAVHPHPTIVASFGMTPFTLAISILPIKLLLRNIPSLSNITAISCVKLQKSNWGCRIIRCISAIVPPSPRDESAPSRIVRFSPSVIQWAAVKIALFEMILPPQIYFRLGASILTWWGKIVISVGRPWIIRVVRFKILQSKEINTCEVAVFCHFWHMTFNGNTQNWNL